MVPIAKRGAKNLEVCVYSLKYYDAKTGYSRFNKVHLVDVYTHQSASGTGKQDPRLPLMAYLDPQNKKHDPFYQTQIQRLVPKYLGGFQAYSNEGATLHRQKKQSRRTIYQRE